ncbi:MAG TPA: hypothetical protein VF430_02785, partial [Verrucomicrobiae bacterium]
MKKLQVICCWLVALTAVRLHAEDFLDRVDELLTFTAYHDQIRSRVSGLMDLEGYAFTQPAPGLINTDDNKLFNSRLTLFLDAQLGPHVYVFAQGRVDRGFDPSDSSAQARADEYALRITPWDDGRFNIQAGKFATVVGNWVERHHSWENPFVTAPLPYENITAIDDSVAPSSAKDFVGGLTDPKYEYNPVIWGPSYATGASVFGRLGKFDYAAEMKNASLSSRPESWDATQVGFEYPTFSGRLGFRPNEMWNLGVSASDGPYYRSEAIPTLPPGRRLGDYRELVLGQDFSFAWHHFQLWAECYEVRIDVPRVGNADTLAFYLEAKYKFTPQLFGAVRWNQQLFGSVPDGQGGDAPWGHDIWRIDTALGYRFTAHLQGKLQ